MIDVDVCIIEHNHRWFCIIFYQEKAVPFAFKEGKNEIAQECVNLGSDVYCILTSTEVNVVSWENSTYDK